MLEHALGALAEHPEPARWRARREERRRLLRARGSGRSGGLAGATADQKRYGEREAGGGGAADGGGQGEARLTDGPEPNNAATLKGGGSSRTLLRRDRGASVSKSRRAVHGRVRRGLHAVLAALIWLAPFAEGRSEEAAPARVEARGEVAPAGPGATLRAGIRHSKPATGARRPALRGGRRPPPDRRTTAFGCG
jgi:hypothetical protein